MRIKRIGRYQASQSRAPFTEVCTASRPSPAQARKIAAQVADNTTLIRLNSGVCHTSGGADSLA
jgi:hypothetical protein